MKLSLTITKKEIVRLAEEATPLEIQLGRKRSVSFGRPELVELVPRTGLRVRGHAKMVWELAGLTLPVTLRTWQLLLVPSILRRDDTLVLAFDPVLEDLDLKGVPAAFDDRIVDAINEGVASQRNRLSWNLSKVLGTSTRIPSRVSPGGTFEIVPFAARVEVGSADLRVEIDLDAQVVSQAVATPRSLRSA